ncbi:MAG: hypothetical protein ACI8TQ_002683 [Planctomycetota bacterium]|jgi:hypothetical protein
MESSTSGKRTSGQSNGQSNGKSNGAGNAPAVRRATSEARRRPCLPGMPDSLDFGETTASAPAQRLQGNAPPDVSSRARTTEGGKESSGGGSSSAGTPGKTASGGRGTKAVGTRSLLFGSPREVLARISAGDPLGIRARVAAHLRDRHLLFDADRLHLRAIAHSARQALHLRAADGLDAFLRNRIADAERELRREDRGELKNGDSHSIKARSVERPRSKKVRTKNLRPATQFDELARPLGFKPIQVRAACAQFNESDSADRRACFKLLVDGADLDGVARAEGTTATEIARRARRALEAALVELEGAAS